MIIAVTQRSRSSSVVGLSLQLSHEAQYLQSEGSREVNQMLESRALNCNPAQSISIFNQTSPTAYTMGGSK